VVTLSENTTADAVCTIFETLNRTGVKLSVFELLTARFWPEKVNLRQLWSAAKAKHPIIDDFAIDPYYLLQIISLVAHDKPTCKRSDVLNLESGIVGQWWDRCVDALADGLNILRQDCGILIPQWLPYNTIVNALAAALVYVKSTSGPMVGASREKLRRWYWCSVFGQTYESSPNTQTANDVSQLNDWLAGGQPPETVRSLKFDPAALRDITPRQRAVYRGIIGLILSRGPRDFHTGVRLTGDLIVQHNVDDHHVFPAAYLGKQGVEDKLRDCVLNRTLIDRTTNIKISDRAPSIYMSDIKQALGATGFDKLLTSHLLPAGAGSPLWKDDFNSFLDWRQDHIAKEIVRVTQAT
jgi:hypothetical protein